MLPREEIQSIVILRALQLGDLLCSIPAFRALRSGFPNAHIIILGLPWMKMLPERFQNYIHEYIHFPGYPGLPEQPFNAEPTNEFLLRMAKRKCDLALQMQGNGTIINPMIELFGAKYCGGFFTGVDYKPSSPFFIEYPEGISEVHRHLSLMKHLGMPVDNDEMEFPVTRKDEEELQKASLSLNPKEYICIHAGSRGRWRQWPPGHFARIADHCSQKGYKIVLTGTSDELPIVNEVATNMKAKPVIAAGKTSLGAMAALLKNSGGLISNCTGVSHVASAIKTKSVIVSMDGEPERWAPLNRELHSVIDWTTQPDFELVMQMVDEQFASAS
jgi:ADP-heptose:LPS heptosyltransferase